MDKDELKNKLTAEGFPVVYEWVDEPGTLYEKHQHQEKVSFYIIKGQVTFDFDGQIRLIKAGERFDVPPLTFHTAVVGEDGCEYVVGQMNEDDA